MKAIELLAPVGGASALKAAVNAGADAVYMAGPRFGARRSAENFDEAALAEAVAFCHERGVSAYITVNTLFKDGELSDAMAFVEFLYLAGADAVIVQDLGLMARVQKRFPDFSCHASTQMSFHSSSGIAYAEMLGFERVVPARELSFSELHHIRGQTRLELEIFIHGALCIAYSGQCLMSSHIGGRSGNRGACAQPCRKPYTLVETTHGGGGMPLKTAYLMSPRDLRGDDFLDVIGTLAPISLKIEGRMKGPDYVYSVVGGYRDALDGAERTKDFSRTFNRRFTSGYLEGKRYAELMNTAYPGAYGTEAADVLEWRGGVVTLRLREGLYSGDELQYRDGLTTKGARADVISIEGVRVKAAEAGAVVTVPFKHRIPKGALLYKTYDKHYIDTMLHAYESPRAVHGLRCTFEAYEGKPAVMTATMADGHTVRMVSEGAVEAARHRALTPERVEAQLSKLGGTPFYLAHLECRMDANVSLSAGALNALRRACVESLLRALGNRYPERQRLSAVGSAGFDAETVQTPKESPLHRPMHRPIFYVMCDRPDVALALQQRACEREAALRIKTQPEQGGPFEIRVCCAPMYVNSETDGENAIETLAHRGILPILPRIIRDDEEAAVRRTLAVYVEAFRSVNGDMPRVWIRHVGQLKLAEELSFVPLCDYTLNTLNGAAHRALRDRGAELTVWSPELSVGEVCAAADWQGDMGVWAYGRLPLMLSEYCPVGGSLDGRLGCGRCASGTYALVDAHGDTFPLKCDRDTCRVEVLSPKPVSIMDQLSRLYFEGVGQFRVAVGEKDILDTRVLDALFGAEDLEGVAKALPYDPHLFQRGTLDKGIQ